jgi:LacI family transcriptional regulator
VNIHDVADQPDGGGRRAAPRGPSRLGLVNLKQVAAAAGVSTATASRVFNSPELVREHTRLRVVEAADQLGYVVNGLARSMIGLGPRAVAFVVPSMVGPTFAAMAAAVERVANDNGHLFLLSTTHYDQDREARLIETLREQRAVAALLVGSSPSSEDYGQRVARYARDLAATGGRLVLCGRPPIRSHPEIASATYDNPGAMAAVVRHLAGLGHRRIAFLNMPEGMTTPIERRKGFLDGLAEAGLREANAMIRPCGNTEAEGEAAALALLDVAPDVTAIACATDNIAVGAYRALRKRGLRIPEDISVAGFDDVPVVGDLTPALTTVHPPFASVGEIAVRMALGLDDRSSVVLPTSLMVRESTGPARTD